MLVIFLVTYAARRSLVYEIHLLLVGSFVKTAKQLIFHLENYFQ